MHIEFTLPIGYGGDVGAWIFECIKQSLNLWIAKYQADYPEISLQDQLVKIKFKDPYLYDFFALSWPPDNLNIIGHYAFGHMKNYRIIKCI